MRVHECLPSFLLALMLHWGRSLIATEMDWGMGQLVIPFFSSSQKFAFLLSHLPLCSGRLVHAAGALFPKLGTLFAAFCPVCSASPGLVLKTHFGSQKVDARVLC
jgi:hypothetical protein|mmetsp:Transcript_42341/g.71575  ORF Transcript_42341/g.71575 Transcript_42341/m.71575 type:complete len:105 (+) Transcript_42341:792-1106(+)